MTTTPTEEAREGADDLIDSLLMMTNCIGEALDDLCSYGLTVGDEYTPFNPDSPADDEPWEEGCNPDEDVPCSQAWVRVIAMTPVNISENIAGSDVSLELSVDIEVGVVRCFGVPENGEAVTATQMLEFAAQAQIDANRIYCAAMGCEVWEAINVGAWSPLGPIGGQYGGLWGFTVTGPVTPKPFA